MVKVPQDARKRRSHIQFWLKVFYIDSKNFKDARKGKEILEMGLTLKVK